MQMNLGVEQWLPGAGRSGNGELLFNEYNFNLRGPKTWMHKSYLDNPINLLGGGCRDQKLLGTDNFTWFN